MQITQPVKPDSCRREQATSFEFKAANRPIENDLTDADRLGAFKGSPTRNYFDVVGKTPDVSSWTNSPTTAFRPGNPGVTAFHVPILPTMADITRDVPGIGDSIEFWQLLWIYDPEDRREYYQCTSIARLKPDVTVERDAEDEPGCDDRNGPAQTTASR